MSEFLVAPIYNNSGYRPWRQRRSQGIHNAASAVQFVEAANREEAAKAVALRDTFMFGTPRLYMVVPMSGAKFYEVDAPLVTVRKGTPE